MSILNNVSASNMQALFVDYEPAYSNLFSVNIISRDDPEKISVYSNMHATSINFEGAQLNLSRHSVTKLFALENYQRSDTVSITWREDSKFYIRDFHRNWLSKFYDKEQDCYISYDNQGDAERALYREFVITLQNTLKIKLHKVMPGSIPSLDVSWDNPAVTTYTLSYYVTSWDWEYIDGSAS